MKVEPGGRVNVSPVLLLIVMALALAFTSWAVCPCIFKRLSFREILCGSLRKIFLEFPWKRWMSFIKLVLSDVSGQSGGLTTLTSSSQSIGVLRLAECKSDERRIPFDPELPTHGLKPSYRTPSRHHGENIQNGPALPRLLLLLLWD